jgi:DNA-directed RNA polymerase specialized sigma subunit
MKYEKITKTARNEAVREYARTHKELSHREIGEVFRISKQRIGQILKKAGNNGSH